MGIVGVAVRVCAGHDARAYRQGRVAALGEHVAVGADAQANRNTRTGADAQGGAGTGELRPPALGESPSPRARAVPDRLEAGRERPDAVLARVAPGHLVGGDRDGAKVLNVVVERADAVVDFILDPTRARRSDRVRDVEHSRAANPWADLQAEREWRANAPDPGRERHPDPDRVPVVEPGW